MLLGRAGVLHVDVRKMAQSDKNTSEQVIVSVGHSLLGGHGRLTRVIRPATQYLDFLIAT
jgi:hypothetical protein